MTKEYDIYIPDKKENKELLTRTTHLCIAAHQDDIEIMAYHGISKCYESENFHFTGVTVTNGSGSLRVGKYKDYSMKDMIDTRKKEQIKAAKLGKYNAQIFLGHSSSEVIDKSNLRLIEELAHLITITNPDVIYTHNLADKHDTHLAVVVKLIKAIRLLPSSKRPKQILGCEVWRSLDWVNDHEKVLLDTSKNQELSESLLSVFESQLVGGKNYDKATIERRYSNATFHKSHETETSNSYTYAIDLTPLIKDDNLDMVEYITNYINSFMDDVVSKLRKVI